MTGRLWAGALEGTSRASDRTGPPPRRGECVIPGPTAVSAEPRAEAGLCGTDPWRTHVRPCKPLGQLPETPGVLEPAGTPQLEGDRETLTGKAKADFPTSHDAAGGKQAGKTLRCRHAPSDTRRGDPRARPRAQRAEGTIEGHAQAGTRKAVCLLGFEIVGSRRLPFLFIFAIFEGNVSNHQ